MILNGLKVDADSKMPTHVFSSSDLSLEVLEILILLHKQVS